MHKFIFFTFVSAALLVRPMAVSAQVQPGQSASDRWWSLAMTAGMSSLSPGSGATVGGVMVVDLTERVGLEFGGSWLAAGRGSDGVTLGGGLIVSLRSQQARTVPFLTAGAAAVRASFDMDDRAFLGRTSARFPPGTSMVPLGGRRGGMMDGSYAGPGYWNGNWTGPTVDLSNMPMFYQQRLGVMQMDPNGRWGMRSFTDPALSVGGGVRFNVGERVYVRPDARAIVVLTDADSHTIGMFTIGVGFAF